MKPKKIYLSVLMAAAIVCGGCSSYSSQRPFRKDVKSICVKTFDSRVFRRRIEMKLTEALRKRIKLDTPYRLADENVADTVLKGEILEIRQGTLGRDFRTNLPRETQLTLVVSFEWKDVRTGELLVSRQRWLQTYDYSRPVGEREFDAINGAVDRMAETIVEQMMADW